MIRKILPVKKFPHRFFAVVAVFTLVALLLTFKPIAELVKKGAEALSIKFPPLEVFQNAAMYLLLFGIGVLLLPIAALIPVLIVKVAVVIVALALVGYAINSVFRLVTGKSVTNILPQKAPETPKGGNEKPDYGDTTINRG